MAWNQITIYATQALAEPLSDLLNELGAVSVTLKEGGAEEILEPLPGETPLWCDTQVLGLFEQECDLSQIVETLKQKSGLANFPKYQTTTIADQDWERAWLKDFHPMQFGQNLWIIPSTYAPVDPSAINILLDPGLAFGTGTHPTTALCLQWLDKNKAQDQQVIDFGCGSGILAIATAKLGASRVYAVDIDPQAVTATQVNAVNNGVSGEVNASLVSELGPVVADLLLANILANPLKTLAKSFSQLLKPGASVVLSGILQTQADSVLQVYAQWFDMDQPEFDEGWAMLSGKRKIIMG